MTDGALAAKALRGCLRRLGKGGDITDPGRIPLLERELGGLTLEVWASFRGGRVWISEAVDGTVTDEGMLCRPDRRGKNPIAANVWFRECDEAEMAGPGSEALRLIAENARR